MFCPWLFFADSIKTPVSVRRKTIVEILRRLEKNRLTFMGGTGYSLWQYNTLSSLLERKCIYFN
jgi:hypothetical protein